MGSVALNTDPFSNLSAKIENTVYQISDYESMAVMTIVNVSSIPKFSKMSSSYEIWLPLFLSKIRSDSVASRDGEGLRCGSHHASLLLSKVRLTYLQNNNWDEQKYSFLRGARWF